MEKKLITFDQVDPKIMDMNVRLHSVIMEFIREEQGSESIMLGLSICFATLLFSLCVRNEAFGEKQEDCERRIFSNVRSVIEDLKKMNKEISNE